MTVIESRTECIEQVLAECEQANWNCSSIVQGIKFLLDQTPIHHLKNDQNTQYKFKELCLTIKDKIQATDQDSIKLDAIAMIINNFGVLRERKWIYECRELINMTIVLRDIYLRKISTISIVEEDACVDFIWGLRKLLAVDQAGNYIYKTIDIFLQNIQQNNIKIKPKTQSVIVNTLAALRQHAHDASIKIKMQQLAIEVFLLNAVDNDDEELHNETVNDADKKHFGTSGGRQFANILWALSTVVKEPEQLQPILPRYEKKLADIINSCHLEFVCPFSEKDFAIMAQAINNFTGNPVLYKNIATSFVSQLKKQINEGMRFNNFNQVAEILLALSSKYICIGWQDKKQMLELFTGIANVIRKKSDTLPINKLYNVIQEFGLIAHNIIDQANLAGFELPKETCLSFYMAINKWLGIRNILINSDVDAKTLSTATWAFAVLDKHFQINNIDNDQIKKLLLASANTFSLPQKIKPLDSVEIAKITWAFSLQLKDPGVSDMDRKTYAKILKNIIAWLGHRNFDKNNNDFDAADIMGAIAMIYAVKGNADNIMDIGDVKALCEKNIDAIPEIIPQNISKKLLSIFLINTCDNNSDKVIIDKVANNTVAQCSSFELIQLSMLIAMRAELHVDNNYDTLLNKIATELNNRIELDLSKFISEVQLEGATMVMSMFAARSSKILQQPQYESFAPIIYSRLFDEDVQEEIIKIAAKQIGSPHKSHSTEDVENKNRNILLFNIEKLNMQTTLNKLNKDRYGRLGFNYQELSAPVDISLENEHSSNEGDSQATVSSPRSALFDIAGRCFAT